MVPSLNQTSSESYVWAYPGCLVRILLSLHVIDQLQAEVSQSAPWRGEAGGLLIRSKKSDPGSIRIVDFIPLPGAQKAPDPRFKLPSESLAEAIARCPSDSKIVGYYRTDADQRVHLRPEDLETIEQWFKDPASVFLVIASGDQAHSTAGFFFWENGSVATNPSLTFPFDAAKLVSEGWPTEAEPVEKERFTTITGLFLRITEILQRMSIPVKLGIVSALFASVIGLRVFTWNRTASHSKVVASPSLGLQVKRDGTKFLVAWNPSTPAIANAKDANLVIWDSSRQAWDGSNDPLYMPLTSGQLRSGTVSYTSFAFTEKVKFRLDTIGPSGEAVSESMVSVSPLSIASPAAERSVLPANPAPPAAENLPPQLGGRATPATPPPAPLARSLRAANRRFVPPKSVRAAGAPHDSMMPDPPNIVVEVVSGLALDPALIRPNAVTAPGPPASSTAARLNPGAAVETPNGRPNEGVVTITSEPSGARVEINAIPAGVTPITLQISPVGLGFTVTVTKSGYMKWTVQSFSTNQPYSLHAQLRQIPK
ncbi:MAG: PEGA domain-containing protein [Bryobacteraceae bacterium]